MEKLKAIYKIIKPFINKYTIVIGGCILFMSFGEYSIIERIRLEHSVSELEKEKAQYEQNIKKAREDLKQLNKNNENLERMAREKYNMRKANEEVFIIKYSEADSVENN